MGHIAYIVHDLNDPAVARRVRMLHAAGQDVVVLGFFRGDTPPDAIDGAPARSLGRTADARLGQRAFEVVRNLVFAKALLTAAQGADAIVARNLEGLAMASRARRSRPQARLVYECLDIHRLLLGTSLPARALRKVEQALLSRIDHLIVSSPAFLRHHFDGRAALSAPSLLVENKYLHLAGELPKAAPPPPGPPWTIGWLGNLRCRKTFDTLTALVRRHDGKVRLLVAGRPSEAVFEDLPGALARLPHCTYLGPYTSDQQAEIYARCHFAWAIDWFEEGLNSSWLLPNRLYEAQAFGVVPIALASVETGKWLARHGAGVVLDDGLAEFDRKVADIDFGEYLALRAGVEAIAREDLISGEKDLQHLTSAIFGSESPIPAQGNRQGR